MAQPRSFLRYPNQFGRADPAMWRKVEAEERHVREAAQLQHNFVRAARQQQDRMDQGTNATAGLIMMNADQLRRIYRGEAGLTLENLYKIALAVGLEVKVQFAPND